ncbi:Na+/melibiose symporter [Acetitomaculum ruminis DSM 5522]|uniref:Na+/melibiose symporter n=1 Tax=Acetitomaculum ruminis DSM 5522 TaxID=1120918 RepID=A0A1I0Y1Z7_9FIRM|nr:MFS transporter [Acetitomaculum ruminis]SFB06488.1 Na+/melibiose symporter [Acetitomaculum ruminis DSM 5522]
MDEKKRLTRSEINRYAFYGFGSSVAVMVPLSYLTIFMTENLLMSAALMGSTLLIARTIDFIVGLIAGGFVEKSTMKWGKYISWIKILKWPALIGIFLYFFDTTFLPMAGRVVISILAYCMLNCSMNFLATAQYGILAVMAGPSMEDRNILAVRNAQMMAAATIITSAVTIPAINLLTPFVGQSNGYCIVATAFGLIYIIGCNIVCKVAKPYDHPQTKEMLVGVHGVTVSDMVRSVLTNGQLLTVVLSYSIFYIGIYISSGVMAYYFMYVLGNYLLMTVAMTATTVFALLASVIGPKIGAKLGKKNAMVVGLMVYAIGSLLITFLCRTNLIVYIVLGCINSLGMYIFSGFGVNYMLDAGEYGLYKTGKDNRAVAMSMMNVPMKIGMAFGGAIAGYGLAFIGFTTGMQVTESFITNFMWLLGGVPALFYAAAALLMLFAYRISDEDAARYAMLNAKKLMEPSANSLPEEVDFPDGAPA